jgi:hypothetical protein
MTGGRRWALWDLDVPLDRERYERIAADLREHGGRHAPHEPWHGESLFPDEPSKRAAPAWTDLLRPWVSQAVPAGPEDVEACRSFIREHAPGGLLPRGGEAILEGRAEAGIVDLRTLLDVALITAHLPAGMEELTVLEIGGGYGRLAEAFLGLERPRVRHVLVDAVPGSLYYAHAYLRQRLPERTIGSYYDGDDPADCDAYVVPRWHAEPLIGDGFDVGVNIASFQEMRDDQVDEYLALLDSRVRDGGQVYLCNSRVFAFRRRFTYPASWELRFKRTTPFSYLRYKPVEILRRDPGADHTAANTALDRDYLEDIFHEEHGRFEGVREENRLLRRAAGRLEELEAELRALRRKAGRADALAAEVRGLRRKAARFDAVAADLPALRRHAARYAALAADVPALRRKAARYDALAAELPELRLKARRYDRLVDELPELRGKARKFDRLASENKRLRRIARRYDELTRKPDDPDGGAPA